MRPGACSAGASGASARRRRLRLFGAGVRLAEALPAPLLYRLARGAAGPAQSAPHPGPAGAPAQPGGRPGGAPGLPLPAAPYVRGAYRTQCANYADLLRGRRLSAAEASARTVAEGEGWAPFRQAIAARRGALLVTAHLGRIELMSHFLGGLGIPLTLPVERIEPPALLELVTSLRTRPGFTLVPSDLGLRPTLRALQRGDAVVLFADWDSTGHGVEVPFFGRPARLPAGPALLAVRTGAPLFVAFAFEGPSGQTSCTPPWARPWRCSAAGTWTPTCCRPRPASPRHSSGPSAVTLSSG